MLPEYAKTAERLKALAEPTRLQILEMLHEEEMCVLVKH
jgi:DNA-binding transcriptional ArsR family regulator